MHLIRQLKEEANGLGVLALIPETDEERSELERVCPRTLPAGIIHRYEWSPQGACQLIAELDPNYKPEPVTPPPASPRFLPVPTKAKLQEWPAADLQTRLAELDLDPIAGETKAAMSLRIIDAWTKRNAEIEAASKPAK